MATRMVISGVTSSTHSHPQGPNLSELQATIMVLIQQLEEVQLAELYGAHCFLVLFSGKDLASL